MKRIEDYFVPWLKEINMYISPHIELALEESETTPDDVQRESQ